MKCVRCGLEYSDFFTNCPSCGFDPNAPAMTENVSASDAQNYYKNPDPAPLAREPKTTGVPDLGSAPAQAPTAAGAYLMLPGDERVNLELQNEIGRSKECNIKVSDNLVSRKHAGIFREGDAWIIEDMNSSNGVYVNGQRLEAGSRRKLRSGDTVRFATTFEFTFIDENERDPEPEEIDEDEIATGLLVDESEEGTSVLADEKAAWNNRGTNNYGAGSYSNPFANPDPANVTAGDMSFFDAVKSVFTKYAVFEGRARRKEYWYFMLFNMMVSFVLSFLSGYVSPFFAILSVIYSLGALIPGIALCVRRLHDLGKKGTYYFWMFCPFMNIYVAIIIMFNEGVRGANEFGPDPKM